MPFPQVGQPLYGGWTQEGEQYSDLKTRFSSYNTKAAGLVCDSVADDRAGLNTLVNVTMQPNGGQLDVIGVPRIASDLTIPVNVRLRFVAGAYLAPDAAATVTINGPFNRHLEKKFGGAGAVVLGSTSRMPYTSPEWWGALGNGVADDAPPWQSAINAWPTAPDGAARNVNRGGLVVGQAATYLLQSAGLTMKRGIAIQCMGSERTQFLYGRAMGDAFNYTSPAALSMLPTIRLRGFRIDMANGVVHLAGAGVNLDGTLYQLRPEIDDVYIFSTFNGLKLTNVQGGHMRMTNVAYCGGDGIVQAGFATLFHVDSCWAASCAGWGWNLDSMAYCHVDACGADSNAGGGWRIGGPTGCNFTIGSEENTGTNILFVNTGGGNKLACRIIGGPATVDGLWIAASNGLECTPVVDTVAAATGYPLRLTGACKSVVVHGANIGTYAAGTKRVSGSDLITYWDDNGQVQIGGSVVPTNSPQYPWGVNLVSGIAGIARKVMAELRHRPSDNGGSSVLRMSPDGSNSFVELEANSLVAGPHTYGTYGDVILRSTGGQVLLVCGAVIAAIASAVGDLGSFRRLLPGAFGAGNGSATGAGTVGIVYGNAAPTAGTWAKGDLVINQNPAVGQPKAWQCTVAGTPGTWVSWGNL